MLKRRIAIMILVLVCVLNFSIFTTVKGVSYSWQAMGPGAGGQIIGFWFDSSNPNRVFIGSDVAGLWKSDNRGDTWTYITKGWQPRYCQDMFIDPNNSNRWFISLVDGIYVTTDGGANWIKYGDVGNGAAYLSDIDGAYDTSGNLVLYVGTGYSRSNNNGNGCVYKRVGNGAWTSYTVPMTDISEAVFSVIVNPNNTDAVWISTGEGVFNTINGGKTWNPKSTGLPDTDCRKMISNPSNSNSLILAHVSGIYSLAAGSTTWVNRTGNLKTTDESYVSVVCDTRSAFGTKLYAGSNIEGYDGVSFTSNGTSVNPTWTNIVPDDGRFTKGWNSGNAPRINPYTLAMAPNGNLWIGSNGNFYRSEDNGAHWLQRYTTKTATVAGTAKPTGSGAQWSSDLWNSSGFDNMFPRQVSVDPNNASRIISSYADRQLMVSRNGGSSWQQCRFYINGTVCGDAFFTKFDPYNPGVVYAGAAKGFGETDGESALFKSTDSGETWSFMAGTAAGIGGLDAPYDIYDIAFAPNGKLYVTVKLVGVFESADGGSTWSKIGLDGKFSNTIQSNPSNSNVLFVGVRNSSGGGKGVWKGTKSGTAWTWTRYITDYECWNIQVDPTNNNRIYAALAGGGLTLSTNGGTSWSTIFDPVANGVGGVFGIAVNSRDGKVYMSHGGDFQNKPKIKMSSNQGQSWTDISGDLACPYSWNMLYVDTGTDEYLYAGCQGLGLSRVKLN